MIKNVGLALAGVAQLVGLLSHNQKVAWSGHIPRLLVQFLVWACMGGNQLMLHSHINVSLIDVPLFPFLSKSNEKKSPCVSFIKNK